MRTAQVLRPFLSQDWPHSFLRVRGFRLDRIHLLSFLSSYTLPALSKINTSSPAIFYFSAAPLQLLDLESSSCSIMVWHYLKVQANRLQYSSQILPQGYQQLSAAQLWIMLKSHNKAGSRLRWLLPHCTTQVIPDHLTVPPLDPTCFFELKSGRDTHIRQTALGMGRETETSHCFCMSSMLTCTEGSEVTGLSPFPCWATPRTGVWEHFEVSNPVLLLWGVTCASEVTVLGTCCRASTDQSFSWTLSVITACR